MLYDSYGLPISYIKLLSETRNVSLDLEGLVNLIFEKKQVDAQKWQNKIQD